MAHRAESIMAAVATALTGLATTGTRVQRGRPYQVDSVPALTIDMGGDEVLPDARDFSRLTRALQVIITAHVQATTNLETILNTIRAEIFAELMSDITMGLGYVVQIQLEQDAPPEIDAGADQPTARQEMTWTVYYTHSGTSTEA